LIIDLDQENFLAFVFPTART